MSNIDLIEIEEPENPVDDSVEDIDEKGGKRKNTTKQQLKVRRAIEDHLEKKRYHKELDYFDDEDAIINNES